MINLLIILQIIFRFFAPFVVPIALLFAKKTKEKNRVYPELNDRYPSTMRILPLWLKFIETPDDVLIPGGLYEETVYSIYKKYGWFISQWYWWGFRNVGHGFHYKYGFPVSELEGQKYKKSKVFGIFEVRYGHKVLRDWYQIWGLDHYAIPRFTVRLVKKEEA